ncbi:hypothetical protein GHT09_007499 [Marmota monax]|uniref:ATM interactor n=1 Tax=Marmota monax TaxID=9995 RepID=A0A834QMU0_MARMO|nr:hypothetical protein GHT09_007499 [Marmota monax]
MAASEAAAAAPPIPEAAWEAAAAAAAAARGPCAATRARAAPASSCSGRCRPTSCAPLICHLILKCPFPLVFTPRRFCPALRLTSSIASQTDAFMDTCYQPGGISRETQTRGMQSPTHGQVQMEQDGMCGNIFESVHSSYSVPADNIISSTLVAETVTRGLLPQNDPKTLNQDIEKSAPILSFSVQNSMLPSQNMTDNQTQTIDLLSGLENILSNFDIEEFFSASNIHTQTEESELSTMNTGVLESLDIETQTDFLLADTSVQPYRYRESSHFLGFEMFDTQTQTDLNFFLDSSPHLPFGSILKHSSFSMSTDSSHTETQTEGISAAKNLSALESKVQLNSTETQTMSSGFETLGSLFFTSNETWIAMDDFLLADLA